MSRDISSSDDASRPSTGANYEFWFLTVAGSAFVTYGVWSMFAVGGPSIGALFLFAGLVVYQLASRAPFRKTKHHPG
jgi:hypothetical protein